MSFQNISEHPENINKWSFWTLMEVLRWSTSRQDEWEYSVSMHASPEESYTGSWTKITYIWHAATLIQCDGVNILTDPIWSSYGWPWKWIGYRRFSDAWIDILELPKIDIILISHNHYDHMDIPTLRYLSWRDTPIILTGLWNTDYLKRFSILWGLDLNWNEKIDIKFESWNWSIYFVPAQHSSARGVFDRDNTLWGGFLIKCPKGNIYFAWDTWYWPFYDSIKSITPEGIDIGLIPIWGYNPSFHHRNYHLNPQEANLLKEELNIKHAVAIHFWVFHMGNTTKNEASEDLKKVLKSWTGKEFFLGESGSSWVFGD